MQVVVGILLEEVVVTGDVVVDGDDIVVEVVETKHDKLIRILRKGSWFTSINIVGNSHTTASRCKKPSICSSGTCMELYSYG